MAHKWGRKLTIEETNYYFQVGQDFTKIRTEGFSKAVLNSELETYNSVTPSDVKLWIIKNCFKGQHQANLLLKDEIEKLIKSKERDTNTKQRWEVHLKEDHPEPKEKARRKVIAQAFLNDLNKSISETDAKILAKTKQLSGLN